MRLIAHAGFHKTGTSSVQQTLRRNGKRLAREFRVFTHRDIPGVCGAARGMSAGGKHGGDPLDAALFAFELAQFLAGLDADDPRPVVISSENLAGHMPGRHGLRRYSVTPAIMARFAEVTGECLPDALIDFHFSTRERESWLRSCYWQHLRATRMTDDFDSYRAAYLPHADLEADVAAVSAAVPAPHRVHATPLEACADLRLGPLEPLLDLMQPGADLRAALTPLPPANRALGAEVADELLRLNRAGLDKAALTAAKKAVMARGTGSRGFPA
ncbi:hypothetical protein [Sediminimonas sp.]|uniref:hypothetical protein n=1 Tax=Sediminimonas sp. TaxID=2823379 RepID=UPI0025CEA0D2|nr:hypothetical protein [Sediminimonas sp.]